LVVVSGEHDRKAFPMTRTISATDARVHFGEVLRGVSEERATYYVERSGTPVAVVIPVEEYEALRQQQRGEYVRPAWLENVLRVGREWSAERVDHTPIDWDRYIDEGREGDNGL
jgi:prevent-host-death family protein